MTAPRSPFTAFATPPRLDAAFTAWNTVASYDDYAAAQRAVDRLSDDGFPVEHLDIIGSDLRLVERVTGRLTKGRAAAAGAASGAWFGLLMGLLLGIFSSSAWFGLLIVGAVIGAGWGAVFGFLGHAATRGARDFASARTIVALRYDLVARNGYVDAAKSGLQQAGLLDPAA
jgi:heat induced stress protein YflT